MHASPLPYLRKSFKIPLCSNNNHFNIMYVLVTTLNTNDGSFIMLIKRMKSHNVTWHIIFSTLGPWHTYWRPKPLHINTMNNLKRKCASWRPIFHNCCNDKTIIGERWKARMWCTYPPIWKVVQNAHVFNSYLWRMVILQRPYALPLIYHPCGCPCQWSLHNAWLPIAKFLMRSLLTEPYLTLPQSQRQNSPT